MINSKYRNKIASRIFATLLTLCVVLSLFTGCTFTKTSDTCSDPNCISCANVVYEADNAIDTRVNLSCTDPDCEDCEEYTVVTSTYVDCPDCENGGEYVSSSKNCTVCGGDGELTRTVVTTCTYCNGSGTGSSSVLCNVCGGDDLVTCPDCNGIKYVVIDGENISCVTCGGNGLRMASSDAIPGTGTVDCSNCVDGYYESTRCQYCMGDGEFIISETYDCTASGCVNGTVTYTTWDECDTCFGESGWYVEDDQEECDHCGYAGLMICPDCLGYGYVTINGENFGCITCGGNGQRMNGATAVAGTGTLACPYCTDSTYYTVDFICVSIGDYGFDDYSATVLAGNAIPSIIGWDESTYYFSSDGTASSVLKKDTIVSSDMTVYVHILDVDPEDSEYTVYYHELIYGGFSLKYKVSEEQTYSAGDILDPYEAENLDDFITNLLYDFQFVGYYVSNKDLGLDGSIFKNYLTYFTTDDICDLENYEVNEDLYLYAIYSSATYYGSDSDSDGNWFSNIFTSDGEADYTFVYIILGICVLLVGIAVIKK